MRESVSGRAQDHGRNPDLFAGDFEVGKQAEDDFIRYIQAKHYRATVERWDLGIPAPRTPAVSRTYGNLRFIRYPDVWDTKSGIRFEIKWRHEACWSFKEKRFKWRMMEDMWPDYLWIDRQENPVWGYLILESPEPCADNMRLAKEKNLPPPPDVYPTGLYAGRVRDMDEHVEYTYQSTWIPLSSMTQRASIEEFREAVCS